MYKGFTKGLDWLGGLVSTNTLTIIAASVLGAILIFQIIMVVCAVVCLRQKGKCCCTMNGWRRWIVILASVLFVVLAMMKIGLFAEMIVVFVLTVIVLEVLFGVIARCCCCCDCCTLGADAPQKIAKTEKPVAVKEVKEVKEAEHEYREPAPVPTEKVKEAPQKVVVSPQKATIPQKKVVAKSPAPKPKMVTRTSTTKIVAIPRAAVTAPHKKVSAPAHPNKEVMAVEKRNERIGELGAKIEKQRLQAERRTDTIVETYDAPYAAQTREAIASAEETVHHMDDLQRRVDTLRDTTTVQDVQTTEYVTRQETSVQSSQRSTLELRREQETLQKQYETLQNKLIEMKQEDSYQSQRADTEFYSGGGDFERTAKSVNVPRTPGRNKFDENEVKAALFGLKRAMDDLQRQIDTQDDRNN